MHSLSIIILLVMGIHLPLEMTGRCEELNRRFQREFQVKTESNSNFTPSSLFAHQVRPKKNIRFQETTLLYEQKRMNSRVDRVQRDIRGASYRRETKPHLLFTPIEQTVPPGSVVSIKCSATGSPDPIMSWMRDGRPIVSSQRMTVTTEIYGREIVSFVNISHTVTRDGGQFTCTAANSLGEISYTTRLNVFGPPFIRPMQNFTGAIGKSVSLWCPAGGYPLPVITWQFRGSELSSSTRYNILGNNTLVILSARSSDEGRYSCIASGKQGSTAMAEAYLFIINPPEIEKFSFNKELVAGKRTLLTCMVTAGDLPITIRWLKNGQPMQHDPYVKQHMMGNFSKSLLFEKLAEHHSGDYTCTARNSAAVTNHTASLKVQVPPSIIGETSDLSVGVGSSVRLECNAKGIPEPKVTWLKSTSDALKTSFQPLRPSSSIQIGPRSLVFTKVMKQDAGSYKCEASNGIGQPASRVIAVNVNAGAVILTESDEVTGHVNREAEIECEVTGDHPLTITWRKEYSIVVSSHRTLIKSVPTRVNTLKSVLEIRDLQPFDKGLYTCEAKNNFGQQTKKFMLTIFEPPSPPQGIVIESVTSKTAQVSWESQPQSDIILNYKEVKDNPWNNRGQNISILQANSFYVLQSLRPFSRYEVRLYGRNDLGVSLPSQSVTFVTLEEAPSASPSNIRVEPVGQESLYVAWSAPFKESSNGVLRGYQIALKEQNMAEGTVFITRPVTHKGGREEYTLKNLKRNQLYEVSVRAFNSVGVGPLSSPRFIQKTSEGVPFCKPEGVECRSDSASTVRVWWHTPSTNCQQASVREYSILGIATQYPLKTQVHGTEPKVHTVEVITTNLEKSIGPFPQAANISLYVRGLNSIGYSEVSDPVFCATLNDIPRKISHLRATSARDGSAFISWQPPLELGNNVIRYTIYYEHNGQVSSVHVTQEGRPKTWKLLHGFKNGDHATFWVTATSVAGESSPSSRVPLRFTASKNYGPIAIAGSAYIRTNQGSDVTIGCMTFGSPAPTVKWHSGSRKVTADKNHQFLAGGDLHIRAMHSANYTCRAISSEGIDVSGTRLVVLKKPSVPVLRILESSTNAINVSVYSDRDGGSPILGYTVYYKEMNNEWIEVKLTPNKDGRPSTATLYNLKCASKLRLYSRTWNAQGTSPSSQVTIASTQGANPPKPSAIRILELNSTCIIFRLYEWMENECPILRWTIDHKLDTDETWNVLHKNIQRDTRDIGLCDIEEAGDHFIRLTAFIDTGSTSVAYKAHFKKTDTGFEAGQVEEISLRIDESWENGWMDAHFIAGIISAILLTIAIIVCGFVIFKRKSDEKTHGQNINSKSSDHPPLDYEIYQPHYEENHAYVKGSGLHKKKSVGSLNSYEGFGPPEFEEYLYPQSTYGKEKGGDTLQYGLSIQSGSPTSRSCFEGASREEETLYGSGSLFYL